MSNGTRIVGPVHLPLEWNGRVSACTLNCFSIDGRRYIVVEVGPTEGTRPPDMLVRIQSACVLGDAFQSRWCDCAWQLEDSKRLLVTRGRALLIYGYDQNGTGLSLEDHFRVYAEGQARGLELLTETFDFLGLKYENRDYGDIAMILRSQWDLAR